MKKILLFLIILAIFLISCSKTDLPEIKAKLKECYEKKCELILEETNFKLDYPFSFCYYEFRKECVDEVSEYLNLKFCNNFTYKKLCYEDLAVIKKDKEICHQAYKPSKDDFLFKEYVKENQDNDEDELFKEYSKAFEEYSIEYNYCKQYYDNAIRVIDEKISHCVDTNPGESDSYRCYPKLIKNFKSVAECDYYADLQKMYTEFGRTEKYGDEHSNCYSWYAGLHNDTSICYNMKTQIQKIYCLGQYAHIRREPKYCEEIEDGRIKGLCISYANEKPRYCGEYLEEDVCRR